MDKKLYRDEFRKKIGGVCAGLAEYFGTDVNLIRVLFVLACIFHGGGIPVYIVLWIVLPKRPFPYPNNPFVDYTVPPQNPGAQNANQPGGTPFGSGPFQSGPFNAPFPNQPIQPQQKGTSLVALIFGVVLIIIGGSILLDNFDILPDWDIEHLWPVIPITVGCILMISGSVKKPWEHKDWHKTDDKTVNETSETNPPADNPPVV